MITVRNLDYVRSKDPRLYETLSDIITQTLDVNVPSPPQVASISVTAADGIFHIVLVDAGNPARAVSYFAEYDTKPNFPSPHVIPMQSARDVRVSLGNLTLYWRGYSQYAPPYINMPSPPIVFGGSTPTPVVGGGSAGPTLPASTGSGTQPVNGQRGGGGFGTNPVRPPLPVDLRL